MKNNCFYYSLMTDSGLRLSASAAAFPAEKNFSVNGQSPAVKQQLFGIIRNELDKKGLYYTDFRGPAGSMGIHCADLNLKIADSEFLAENDKNYTVIFISDYQKTDSLMLSQTEKILTEKQRHIRRAARFFSACGIIKNDIIRLETPYINMKKLNLFTYNLWQRITNGLRGKTGLESKRFITCPTADGIELNLNAFDVYCGRLLTVKDRTGTVSSVIADRLRGYALGSGYDVISCPCSLDSKRVEHIIIPSLSFGFFTSEYYHRDDFSFGRKTYARRFLIPSVKNIKERTDFSITAYRELMNEVFDSLKKADKCSSELNRIYYPVTDIKRLNEEIIKILFCQ